MQINGERHREIDNKEINRGMQREIKSEISRER